MFVGDPGVSAYVTTDVEIARVGTPVMVGDGKVYSVKCRTKPCKALDPRASIGGSF